MVETNTVGRGIGAAVGCFVAGGLLTAGGIALLWMMIGSGAFSDGSPVAILLALLALTLGWGVVLLVCGVGLLRGNSTARQIAVGSMWVLLVILVLSTGADVVMLLMTPNQVVLVRTVLDFVCLSAVLGWHGALARG